MRLSLFRIDLSFPTFISEYKAALKKYPNLKTDIANTFNEIQGRPDAGDLIPRVSGDNLWKIRIGLKGQFGKRGGYRLIYHADEKRRVITPIALYFKRDTPNLPDTEISKRFMQLAKQMAIEPASVEDPEEL
jgi:mRNA-degrading endonuclease RelE of RelBE toxin-antitoxin system